MYNKRGELLLSHLLLGLAGAAAAILLIAIVLKTTSQHGAENQFIVIDSALLTDAILSTPGDVEVAYPNRLLHRVTRLENNSISIFDEIPEPEQVSVYRKAFVQRADVRVLQRDLQADVIYFVKDNNTFTISNYPQIDEEVLLE